MNTQIRSLLISFFVFLLMNNAVFEVNSTASEPSSIGKVKSVSGEAWVSLGTLPRKKLVQNSPLEENSVIQTGKHASVSILLNDESEIRIGENSHLEMNTLAKDPNHVDFTLMEGIVKSLVRKRMMNDRWFKIKTRAATMGVRGTEFVTSVIMDATKAIHEQVWVTDGSVLVSELSGKSMALVEKGMGLAFNAEISPSGAVEFKEKSFTPQALTPSQSQTLKTNNFLMNPKSLPPIQPGTLTGAPTNPGSANSSGSGVVPPPPPPGTNSGSAASSAAGANAVAPPPPGQNAPPPPPPGQTSLPPGAAPAPHTVPPPPPPPKPAAGTTTHP